MKIDRKIFEHQKSCYEESFRNHGESIEAVFWNNQVTQHKRFDRLLKPILELQGNQPFTLFDVGSGFGDLHQYLIDQKVDHEYAGSEIVDGMARATIERYPEVEISTSPFPDGVASSSYDYVVASGTFNLRLTTSEEDWLDYTKEMIGRMFEAAIKGISFNLLTRFADFREDILYYADPGEVISHCVKNLSRFCLVDHACPLYEFTVTVFHHGEVESEHPEPEFVKYFK